MMRKKQTETKSNKNTTDFENGRIVICYGSENLIRFAHLVSLIALAISLVERLNRTFVKSDIHDTFDVALLYLAGINLAITISNFVEIIVIAVIKLRKKAQHVIYVDTYRIANKLSNELANKYENAEVILVRHCSSRFLVSGVVNIVLALFIWFK